MEQAQRNDTEDTAKASAPSAVGSASLYSGSSGKSKQQKKQAATFASPLKTIQLEDDGFDLVDSDVTDPKKRVEEHVDIAKEKNTAAISKEQLAEVQGDGGKNSRIESDGELTMSARFKGLIGKESTFSKFQRLVGDFNKEKDVAKKQLLLKELKPLARHWLAEHTTLKDDDTHETKEKNENEAKKLVTINSFLRQTTSTYPKIAEKYRWLEPIMTAFSEAPIQKRAEFKPAVDLYKQILAEKESYKTNYPPALNLMYMDELNNLKILDDKIIKSGSRKGISFDAEGFNLESSTASFDLIKEELKLVGDISFKSENATGSIRAAVIFNPDGSIKNLTAQSDETNATIAGVDFSLIGIDFNYADKTISIKESSAKTNILDKEVTLTAMNASINNGAFDFSEISGSIDAVDFGFFTLSTATITYNKDEKKYSGSADYKFNLPESIPGFDNFSSTGKVKIGKDPAGWFYSITDGNLDFKLIGQSGSLKNFDYDSRKTGLKAKKAQLDVKVGKIKEKSFKGNDIIFSEYGLDFSKISTDASGEIDATIFSIVPSEYSIVKSAEGKYSLQADGAVNLKFPSLLGVKSSGQIKGNVGFDLSNPLNPYYNIEEAGAKISVPNPLNKISEFLGDGWTSSRYELSAGIPVFPGISAIFGLFIQCKTTFAKVIDAEIGLNKETNEIILKTGTGLDATVEGGIFGGIQAGNELLLALAILLSASGEFKMGAKLGYEKAFPLDKQAENKSVEKSGEFTYSLSGEIKAKAALEVVATALYFFQKRFKLDLFEKSLGEFEFSSKGDKKPDTGKDTLADKSDLDKHIDPDKKADSSGLTIEQLLDLDYSHRFSSKEKLEAIDVIKAAETGRAIGDKEENAKSKNSTIFNNAPLANLQFYNEFIDKRCNWEGIDTVISKMNTMDPQSTDQGHLKAVLSTLQDLGQYINIAQVFVDHYGEKIKLFSAAYPTMTALTAEYRALLDQKMLLITAMENFKKSYLHSGFWGDEKKQQDQIKTSSWFGESNYQTMSKEYNSLVVMLQKYSSIRDLFKATGLKTSDSMMKKHQRDIEAKQGVKPQAKTE